MAAVALAGGCMAPVESPEGIPPDEEDEVGLTAGKADGAAFSECELNEVVAWLNDPATTVASLTAAGVHSRAAKNLIRHRDTNPFDDIQEVDAVSYVGPVAMQKLVGAVEDRCTAPAPGETSVVFSPQPYEQSHLVKVARAIDGAQRSIDIAMYSFSDTGIRDALRRAIARGVSIRMIYDPASSERTSPMGTRSAGLEDDGIDVRWINKVMHHKFAIIDGARTSLDEADGATLISGSGNWSSGAGTRYDENTLFIHGAPELALRFQKEFNHLWKNSRDFVWNASLQFFESMPITDADIADDDSVDAAFTSDNFRVTMSSTYGPTFSVVRGMNTVADRWVDAIMSAEHSIRIASGHLRSRPVAEALVAAKRANPDLEIRIYLDGQEWLSEWAHAQQVRERETCLAAAGTSTARIQDCYDKDYMYAYELHQEPGIDIRFKYYAYRWDYAYADQMHHKYMIIDERTLITGSYNLSDNAEHNTMENIIVLDGEAQAPIVRQFVENFDALWVTRTDDTYDRLMARIDGATSDFPIVFPAMALTWEQVDALKDAIRANCPNVDSAEYRDNAAMHRYCDL